MAHHPRTGYLEITVGPMWAGKSTALIEQQNKFANVLKYNTLVINFSDVSDTDIIQSHDNKTCSAIRLKHLTMINSLDLYEKAEKILIDEAQFFDDLFEFCMFSVEQKRKDVYVYGLCGDFLRDPFGDIPKLYSKADKFVKLNAICMVCSEQGQTEIPGIFTMRTTEDTGQVLIGGSEKYKCVCRYHYLKK